MKTEIQTPDSPEYKQNRINSNAVKKVHDIKNPQENSENYTIPKKHTESNTKKTQNQLPQSSS